MPHRLERNRAVARGVLAAIYAAAGVAHLSVPGPFLLITPSWVPFPREVILGTGLCELAGAAGLLSRRLRRAAGVGLALYAVGVFPANIKHAVDGLPAGQVQLGWWYHVPRLALAAGAGVVGAVRRRGGDLAVQARGGVWPALAGGAAGGPPASPAQRGRTA